MPKTNGVFISRKEESFKLFLPLPFHGKHISSAGPAFNQLEQCKYKNRFYKAKRNQSIRQKRFMYFPSRAAVVHLNF